MKRLLIIFLVLLSLGITYWFMPFHGSSSKPATCPFSSGSSQDAASGTKEGGPWQKLRDLVSPMTDKAPTPTDPTGNDSAVDSSLPGPERARAAADRVRGDLVRDLAEKDLVFGDPVFLRAYKEEKVLEIWIRHRDSGKYELFRTYPVAAASGHLGPKLAEGDGQVPEGFYHAAAGSLKPDSTFHLAINIGYPNAYDRAHNRTGSFIMVHGNAVSIGCLAMTDPKIEEIYTLTAKALDRGQPYVRIHLFPFRMTGERLARESDHPWIDFWRNLKEGHDWFETHRVPPDTRIEDKRYTFHPDASS